jgi:thiamine pyrophosphate-dependent acetolactate synthase large subunit-like protein
VVLAMPLDVQAAHCDPPVIPPLPPLYPPAPAPEAAAALAAALASAQRPVFVAGRGARLAGARDALEQLAEASGALLATSAVAKGLFHGNPWDLGVSGGFASPLAAELISGADLIVGWGCSLNMWTMRHGHLIGPGARVMQVDDDSAAIGAHRPVDAGVLGDVALTARAVLASMAGRDGPGYRSAGLRSRIAGEVRWRDVPYADEGGSGLIDPRTLTIALDDLLPAERVVAVDSGNFMGYPSMFLSVPDENGFCFTQAYQAVGLGLASAIGAALAQPGRLPVAALGDGGALMGISELETVVRLGLPMVIVIYDDEAYGAEVHHFGPDGFPVDTVTFPPADIAAIGRGFGCTGVTVREPGDLAPVRDWLNGSRDRPLVIDAKIASAHGSWWLEEAFRGH